jgi:hypothetical protein
MHLLFLFLALTVGLTGFSQKNKNRQNVYCDGLRQSAIKGFLTINGKTQSEKTSRNGLIKYGLNIYLEDTSFKIIGFVASYDCHSRALFDFNEREYPGACIKAGDPFIKDIWAGDLFVIDCINVEKNGKRYLIHGLQFNVE